MPDDATLQPTPESTGTQSPAAPTTPAAGTPTADAPLQLAAPPATSTGYTYKEDRSNWIPKHRFDEVSTRATRAEQERDAERKRVQALAGVTPTDPDAARTESVKQAFFQMFPQFKHLASLSEEQIQALIQTPQHVAKANESEMKHWQRHGTQQVAAIAERVAEALGADTLTPRQTEKLRTTFSSWLNTKARSEFQASDGQGSETLQKYEDGDPSVIDAFVKEYVEDFVAPARRQVAAQNINRNRPVPNSAGRSQVTSVPRPEQFKSWDDRIEFASKLAQERGMQFGK